MTSSSPSDARQPLPLDPRVRRALRRQGPRRRREHAARMMRLQAALKLVAAGMSWQAAADCLRVPGRTLRHWRRREEQNTLVVSPRGRPLLTASIAQRNQVFWILENLTGPSVGLATLQALLPKVPRVVLADMLRRYRRWWRAVHALDGYRLTWHGAGLVWAMDYTKTAYLIDGQTWIILTVRDLATGYQLCWIAVPDQRAETLLPILRALFSPPGQPRYNGALERSNTTMKDLTHTSAVANGHPLHWTSADLRRASEIANTLSRPWGAAGPTPAECWESRPRVDDQQRAVLTSLLIPARDVAGRDLGLPEDVAFQEWEPPLRRAVDRLALSRCLREMGLLTMTPLRYRGRVARRVPAKHRSINYCRGRGFQPLVST